MKCWLDYQVRCTVVSMHAVMCACIVLVLCLVLRGHLPVANPFPFQRVDIWSMSPFSSGVWWLLPLSFLHSHLRLQQPGEQHPALLRPPRGPPQAPQHCGQEETQDEGPQELTSVELRGACLFTAHDALLC